MMDRGQLADRRGAIGDLLADAVRTGRLRATTDVVQRRARDGDLSISVGHAGLREREHRARRRKRVSEQIGEAIARKPDRHLVVVRSTVLPGTVRGR